MSTYRLVPSLAAALAAVWALGQPLAQAAPAKSPSSSESTLVQSLTHSHELWATIDVCNAPDQPDTVGIRGSMPGDGRPHDQMYMSFRLQYEEAKTARWFDLPGNGAPRFVHVGAGASIRQGGRSFQLQPQAGKPAFMLRGVVDYQWRRAGLIIASATRATTVGHKSLAGADPAGYTAAGCLIG